MIQLPEDPKTWQEAVERIRHEWQISTVFKNQAESTWSDDAYLDAIGGIMANLKAIFRQTIGQSPAPKTEVDPNAAWANSTAKARFHFMLMYLNAWEFAYSLARRDIGRDFPPNVIPEYVCTLIAHKQYNYGPRNILDFGILGIIIRTNDKVARLNNLMNNRSAESSLADETIVDTLSDLMGYSIVAAMLADTIEDGTSFFELPLSLPVAGLPEFLSELNGEET